MRSSLVPTCGGNIALTCALGCVQRLTHFRLPAPPQIATSAIAAALFSVEGPFRLACDVLKVRISSTLRRVVVFTRPQRDNIAIEPVSHVNNAMSLVDAGADPLSLGVEILQPGETLSAQMTIEVERS